MKMLKKINSVVIAVLIGAVMLIASPMGSADDFDTLVGVDPVSQTVAPGETFTVNVSCVPGQPVKALELKLSFDASLVQANSVTEGDIFDGYTTFFNAGTIDNNEGNIVNVYGLILGQGNVSDPGSFVTLSFTAKSTAAVSLLDLYSVGVCDENGYLSIVVADGAVTVGTGDPPPPPGPPGPPPTNPEDGNEENNPPETPIRPSGPVFVEMGVEYGYVGSTVDVDGDQIRYRFDWGDGNMSEWSVFVGSNTSVLMFHSWNTVDTYQVRVVAQDEYGLNSSSWSPVLNVTVSGVDSGGEPPVVVINVSANVSVNQTVVFDASGCFDPDGVIVSYLWDFGDGEVGSGVNPVHVYTQPGVYLVTLVTTDNAGHTSTEGITITVGASMVGSEEKQRVMPVDFALVIISAAVAFLVCLAVVFRDRIHLFTLNFRLNSLTQDISRQTKQIKKLKAKSKK
jgi:hypothetical protein